MSDRSNVTWEFDPASLGLGSCVRACVASVNPTDDCMKIWPPLFANAARCRFAPGSRWDWYHYVLAQAKEKSLRADMDVAGVLAVWGAQWDNGSIFTVLFCHQAVSSAVAALSHLHLPVMCVKAFLLAMHESSVRSR